MGTKWDEFEKRMEAVGDLPVTLLAVPTINTEHDMDDDDHDRHFEPKTFRTYLSPNGKPLVFVGEPRSNPTLTIENYEKWYALYLVMPDGTVEEVDGGEFTEVVQKKGPMTAWYDHVPSPVACDRYAVAKGYAWCWQSLEMIIGRYAREIAEVPWAP